MSDPDAQAGWDFLKSIAKKMEPEIAKEPSEELLKFEAEQQRKLDEFHAKYPGNDGSETAMVTPEGDLCVQYAARGDGLRTHGHITYKRDDPEFPAMWRRHKMNEANGRSHFIMMKWNNENKQWIDLGDGWSG